MQCAWSLALAQGASDSGAKAPATPQAPATKAAATQPASNNAGEKKFQANCSRCHNAPQELSPRIAGTVLQHMRARASLSVVDERAILRYLTE